MISDARLSFWIKNQYNVIFRGKHGVGKTATILNAFEHAGLKWQYFSASTMDPWVDFIGVPKEKTDDKGNSYLDLVRPKHFQEDNVEAIFLDEFNRSSKKVRNAVMELIQFKSINGKKFNNLKIIWAAINPEGDEDGKYDVEALDPAQLDRFHVIVDVPYAPHAPYFRQKYGEIVANTAILWWKGLEKEQKNLVSPRRLDYAIDMFTKGGDLKDVLPSNVNVNKLVQELVTGPTIQKFQDLLGKNDMTAVKEFLQVENNFSACKTAICQKDVIGRVATLLPEEKLMMLVNADAAAAKFVFNNYQEFSGIISNVAKSRSGPRWREAETIVKKYNVTPVPSHKAAFRLNSKYLKPSRFSSYHPIDVYNKRFNLGYDLGNTYNRRKVYEFYYEHLPAQLDDQLAQKACIELSEIAYSTQRITMLHQMPDLLGCLNHAIFHFLNKKKMAPISSERIRALIKKFGSEFILMEANDNEHKPEPAPFF